MSTYPSELPNPTKASHTPKVRNFATDLEGPASYANRERDFTRTIAVEFFFTAEQAAIFYAWWRDDLLYGGKWFNCSWPSLTPGRMVAQFVTEPAFNHVYNGAHRIAADVQVRGASLFFYEPVGNGVLPTVRGTGGLGANGDLSTSQAVVWPTGTLAGDLGLLVAATNVGRTFNTPAGWNLKSSLTVASGSGGVVLSVFWKYALGADPNVTVSVGGGGTAFVLGAIFGVRGVYQGALDGPFDVQGTQTNPSSTSFLYPSIVTREANTQVFLLAVRTTSSYPGFGLTDLGNLGGYAEYIDTGFSSGARQGTFVVGHAPRTATGTTGTVVGSSTQTAPINTLAFNVFG